MGAVTDLRATIPTDIRSRFESMSSDEQDEILAISLERLAMENEIYCETLLRAVYYEEAYEEIASSMEVTKGAVSKRKDKALDRLRELIENEMQQRFAASMSGPQSPPAEGKLGRSYGSR